MSERISWLDGWRGIACILMIIYHLLFDLYMFGWMAWGTLMSWPLMLMEKYIAYSFILCAGASSTLSRSNWKRGLITLGAAALVTVASYIADAPIKFGVLQFLGMAMLIYAAAGKWVERVPERLAPVLWLALFVGFHILTDRVLVEPKWLFWLGFRARDFVSYDYFPLLPYIFLFFFGGWLGQELKRHRERLVCVYAARAPRALTAIGKHTMWIYLAHQPVLYGACWLIWRFL